MSIKDILRMIFRDILCFKKLLKVISKNLCYTQSLWNRVDETQNVLSDTFFLNNL